jgi:glycosyltransferase involved in cell wall biosynthesis
VKIAYFSPLPPKRTGIATYSSYLIPALLEQFEVDLFDHGDTQWPAANCQRFDYVADPNCLLTLDHYDARLYHIGNQPDYHSEIYRVLLKKPGIVVLHDTILYFLMAGGGPGALLKELCVDRGRWALRDWREILAKSPSGDILHYPHPERFPLLTRVLRQASAVVVHSEVTKGLLVKAGCRVPIHVVHMPAAESAVLKVRPNDNVGTRAELGIPENALLIGAFGFIGKTKRLDQLLKALDRAQLGVPFRLLIIGAGDDLRAAVERSGIRQLVIRRGFVPDEDFMRYMAEVEIVVNLRYPSMGEASLTLIQAMACGRPCIVTNHAWFAELPDDCVWKIPYGKSEIEALGRAVTTLSADGNLRKRFGDAAHRYVLSHCLPAQVAGEYKTVLENHRSLEVGAIADTVKQVEESSVQEYYAGGEADQTYDWVSTYFARRIARALP